MTADVQHLIFGFIEGVGAAVVFLLALFIGFTVLFNLPKFRATSRKTLVIKSLDERVGEPIRFLPPDAPRGQVDQLAAGTRRAART
ncbi:MAG: hypothetical protein HYU53_10775 [Acidobacteria bacterium]|nr:hypothetical protein [Acidobacteriota bacterium]